MEGTSTASVNRSHVTYGRHSNPSVPRNPLMASDTLTSSTVSENPFESEGSPPDPRKESPAPAPTEQSHGNQALHTSPIRPSIDTQHDELKLRDKKLKAQCTRHGSLPFQIQLMDIMQKHGCPMTLHYEVINLVNNGLLTGNLSTDNPPLLSRKPFLRQVERTFHTIKLKPRHQHVKLSDGSVATVSTFDIEQMILSLITDDSLMSKENIAEGYDLHSGLVDKECESNKRYGEIHTGDAWEPALRHYCGSAGKYMPLSLVVFGDKTHTDLHGSLSLTPVIFTLSCFNRKARNNPNFWRPIAYIPNLSHGRGKSSKVEPSVKVQDEHNCLAVAFNSLSDLHRSGKGIRALVRNKFVTGVVWIHFFIGDIQGNNTWLGHYNASCPTKRPYRDCWCRFLDMSIAHHRCIYVTLSEINQAYEAMQQASTEKEKRKIFKRISKHPIKNAFIHGNIPLSDLKHGPFKMTPPELLHTSGSGIILYMF